MRIFRIKVKFSSKYYPTLYHHKKNLKKYQNLEVLSTKNGRKSLSNTVGETISLYNHHPLGANLKK